MKKSQTTREFIQEHEIIARLAWQNTENDNDPEVFLNEDSMPTLKEEEAMRYEAQDMEELVEHGETLTSVLNGIMAIFYAPDGGSMEGWITVEELDQPIPEDHFLRELA